MSRHERVALTFGALVLLAGVAAALSGVLEPRYAITGYAVVEDFEWFAAPQASLAGVSYHKQGLFETGCAGSAQSIFGATGTDLLVTLMPEGLRYSTGAWATNAFDKKVTRPFKICNVEPGSHTVCAVAFGDTGGFLDQDCKELYLP